MKRQPRTTTRWIRRGPPHRKARLPDGRAYSHSLTQRQRFHLYLVDLPGMRSAGSADWSGLFNSFFWIDRQAGIGAVIATQLLPFFDDKMVQTILGFEAAVYAELCPTDS